MFSTVHSAAIIGLEALPIIVEVDILNQGLPKFIIVGLPDKAVDESKERVRFALKNSGFEFPNRRITVNLAPGDIPKEGPIYDMPIAVGILIASGQINPVSDRYLFSGELALDGTLRPINGSVLFAIAAKEKGYTHLVIPQINAPEASLIKDVTILAPNTLSDLTNYFKDSTQFALPFNILSPDAEKPQAESHSPSANTDMSHIQGQHTVKRALEIAAAGNHNIFMVGPPGAGKTLLARTFSTIMPPLTDDEMLELTKLYSASGHLSKDDPIVRHRPFRSPHHTGSVASIVGGGTIPKPGEISLAHRGVLFLDEFLEFPKLVLEALRQPLEDGHITVTRTALATKFPAKFTLLAAANPCPCGYSMSNLDGKTCSCSEQMISRYRKKLSGPILDRIDLQIHVRPIPVDELSKVKESESSDYIRARVAQARLTQHQRFADLPYKTNGEMSIKELRKFCQLEQSAQTLLHQAVDKLKLSARAYNRILKVSRTIADLAQSETIQPPHVAEVLQYRLGDTWG